MFTILFVMVADQVEELVREWIDLVMERDRLLHEELQQVSNEDIKLMQR